MEQELLLPWKIFVTFVAYPFSMAVVRSVQRWSMWGAQGEVTTQTVCAELWVGVQ